MTHDAPDSLGKAFLAFQQAMPPLAKDAQGHGYRYISLGALMARVQPVLNEHGLTVHHKLGPADEGGMSVQCVLTHAATGEVATSAMVWTSIQGIGGRMSLAQAWGAAVTYARRYTMLALLGLAPDEDEDAAMLAAGTSKPVQTPKPPPEPEAAKRQPPPDYDWDEEVRETCWRIATAAASTEVGRSMAKSLVKRMREQGVSATRIAGYKAELKTAGEDMQRRLDGDYDGLDYAFPAFYAGQQESLESRPRWGAKW